jgi:heat shock protein HtpX
MSIFKTGLLMALLTVLLILVGSVIGGQNGIVIAFIFAVIMNFGSYWFSDKIVLAMYRAQEVNPSEAPELYRIVERLAQKANLPMPRVYIVPVDAPNAFATGRNPKHAVVAVTTGMMNTLPMNEIESVLGHELAHVKNRDTLLSTVAATMAGVITMLASMARWGAILGGFRGNDDDEGGGMLGFLFLAILAPIAAMLLQLAISRSREYKADRDGSIISGKPLDLADALRKMDAIAHRQPLAVGNPSVSNMFIVNPFKRGGLSAILSTHPPIQKRIERLEAMAR